MSYNNKWYNEWFNNQAEADNNEERFEHYICHHEFNRIKVRLYDGQEDEIYTLDIPKDAFEKILEIMTEFKNGTYKPSNQYKEN